MGWGAPAGSFALHGLQGFTPQGLPRGSFRRVGQGDAPRRRGLDRTSSERLAVSEQTPPFGLARGLVHAGHGRKRVRGPSAQRTGYRWHGRLRWVAGEHDPGAILGNYGNDPLPGKPGGPVLRTNALERRGLGFLHDRCHCLVLLGDHPIQPPGVPGGFRSMRPGSDVPRSDGLTVSRGCFGVFPFLEGSSPVESGALVLGIGHHLGDLCTLVLDGGDPTVRIPDPPLFGSAVPKGVARRRPAIRGPPPLGTAARFTGLLGPFGPTDSLGHGSPVRSRDGEGVFVDLRWGGSHLRHGFGRPQPSLYHPGHSGVGLIGRGVAGPAERGRFQVDGWCVSGAPGVGLRSRHRSDR